MDIKRGGEVGSDGFDDGGSEGDGGYEMSIHDVDMKPICPCLVCEKCF